MSGMLQQKERGNPENSQELAKLKDIAKLIVHIEEKVRKNSYSLPYMEEELKNKYPNIATEENIQQAIKYLLNESYFLDPEYFDRKVLKANRHIFEDIGQLVMDIETTVGENVVDKDYVISQLAEKYGINKNIIKKSFEEAICFMIRGGTIDEKLYMEHGYVSRTKQKPLSSAFTQKVRNGLGNRKNIPQIPVLKYRT